MDANKKKTRVAVSSVLASALLTILKLVAGLMTGSIGILSEAAHSLLDFGAAAMTWFAVNMSSKPADRKHHYGHAKIESITALIEAGLLLLTSVWIISAATERLLGGEAEVNVTWYAIAVLIISIIVDFSRAGHSVKSQRKRTAPPLKQTLFTSVPTSSVLQLSLSAYSSYHTGFSGPMPLPVLPWRYWWPLRLSGSEKKPLTF